MVALTKWSPRLPRPIERLEREFGEMIERVFGEPFFGERGPVSETETFIPRVNVVESETAFEVTAELPGVKPEEVSVELRNGDLWISGEHKEEKEETEKTHHRIERRYGSFRRVLPLPPTVNPEGITAETHEGVLRVVIPKTEEAKPKRISVQAT